MLNSSARFEIVPKCNLSVLYFHIHINIKLNTICLNIFIRDLEYHTMPSADKSEKAISFSNWP